MRPIWSRRRSQAFSRGGAVTEGGAGGRGRRCPGGQAIADLVIPAALRGGDGVPGVPVTRWVARAEVVEVEVGGGVREDPEGALGIELGVDVDVDVTGLGEEAEEVAARRREVEAASGSGGQRGEADGAGGEGGEDRFKGGQIEGSVGERGA
jgi:hypothetical protein